MPTTPPPTSRGLFPAPRAERTPAFLEHDRAAARTEWKDAATLLASIRRPRRSRFAPPSITSVRKISIPSPYSPLLVSNRGTPTVRLPCSGADQSCKRSPTPVFTGAFALTRRCVQNQSTIATATKAMRIPRWLDVLMIGVSGPTRRRAFFPIARGSRS